MSQTGTSLPIKLPEWITGRNLVASAMPNGRVSSACACTTAMISGLASKIAGREPILLNPEDAATRGIGAGDVVRVFNERGACLAGAVLTTEVMTGVVQLATGAWYDPADPNERQPLDRHGNANVLTVDKGSSSLAQAPIAHSALVEVELFAGEPPPVGITSPPKILENDARRRRPS